MAGTGRKWLVGCGVGCAVAALLAILVTVGGGIFLTRPFNRAATTQRELTEALGAREDFEPPLAGLERSQLKRFYSVRLAVDPMCKTFEEIAAKFTAMDEFDEREDEPPVGETLKAVGGVMGAAMGMAGNIGKHAEVRNRALLAEEMSLGEYVWIYVLVYNSWLGHPPNEGFEESDSGSFTRKERRLIRTLMENHVETLTEAGRDDEAAVWQAEVDRIMDTESGVPFADGGFPPALVAVIEPLGAQLDAVYCAETSSFELAKVRKKGLSFHTE